MPNRKKVLVVDDDEMLREAIVFLLEEDGFRVDDSSNAKD